MNKRLPLFMLMLAVAGQASARTIYVAPDGDNKNTGTIDAPMATLPAAYGKCSGGDTIYFRGGTYYATDGQIMKNDNTYAYVYAIEKAGTSKKRTCIMGYPGERPVFDFSRIQAEGKYRIAAFYLGADYLHLRNFDIVGVPVRLTGHTQSECVSARKGSHCIVENIAMHDGMAIGYYQTEGSDNLILNCDAYNNYDGYSEGAYGGNVDGFGCHVTKERFTGNVFRGCRAWRNSDDGFDLINCATPVEIDHCWAFYNGFRPTSDPQDIETFVSAGDGNGFKAGGWGMSATVANYLPAQCPQHYVHHSVAVRNKSNGIYANHHLGGNRWEYNTSAQNQRDNYNMVNRKSKDEAVDVDGYGHQLVGNVSWQPNKEDISNCAIASCVLTNNSFGPTYLGVIRDYFVATDHKLMFASRDVEGNLPETGFLVGKYGMKLAVLQMGWAWQEEDTGVGAVGAEQQRSQTVYDLTGRRVKQLQPGRLYIVNGKKMIAQ